METVECICSECNFLILFIGRPHRCKSQIKIDTNLFYKASLVFPFRIIWSEGEEMGECAINIQRKERSLNWLNYHFRNSVAGSYNQRKPSLGFRRQFKDRLNVRN